MGRGVPRGMAMPAAVSAAVPAMPTPPAMPMEGVAAPAAAAIDADAIKTRSVAVITISGIGIITVIGAVVITVVITGRIRGGIAVIAGRRHRHATAEPAEPAEHHRRAGDPSQDILGFHQYHPAFQAFSSLLGKRLKGVGCSN